MEEQPVDPFIMGWPLFIDILTGLDHIHEQGFIHLDIKVFFYYKFYKYSKLCSKFSSIQNDPKFQRKTSDTLNLSFSLARQYSDRI